MNRICLNVRLSRCNQQEMKKSPHLDQIQCSFLYVFRLSIPFTETQAASNLWCLTVFAIIQDGFSVGHSSEEDGVDKAGVSLPPHHPGCFGQIIKACAQTTRQGFVLSPGRVWLPSSCFKQVRDKVAAHHITLFKSLTAHNQNNTELDWHTNKESSSIGQHILILFLINPP